MVIVSLVRSNVEGHNGGKIGFTGIANRINVTVSRAKHGLYIFGNMALMRHCSPLWEKMATVAESRGQFGPALPLQCPNHADEPVVMASTPLCFTSSPHGGCTRPCKASMDCGHTCVMACHAIDHSKVLCIQSCIKPQPLAASMPLAAAPLAPWRLEGHSDLPQFVWPSPCTVQ